MLGVVFLTRVSRLDQVDAAASRLCGAALMREGRTQSHAQTSLPTAKITTHPMKNRKIETARSLRFLNSLNPSLIRVGRREKIDRTKRKIGIAAATKAMILKIIVHSF
jgi:hypothetical protein